MIKKVASNNRQQFGLNRTTKLRLKGAISRLNGLVWFGGRTVQFKRFDGF